MTAAPAALRMPLVRQETERMVLLGSDTAVALERVMRGWEPAERECDLAARIAATLEERLIFPSVLLVGGGGAATSVPASGADPGGDRAGRAGRGGRRPRRPERRLLPDGLRG
jgi:hypothetical protein